MSTQQPIGQNSTSAPPRSKHLNKSRSRGATLERAGHQLVPPLVVVVAATVFWRVGVIELPRVWATSSTGGHRHDYPCEECPPTNCPPGSTSNNPGGDGGCPNCMGPPVAAAGMVTWDVSEPMINLWLRDTPLFYQPGHGEPIEFKLLFKSNPDSDLQNEQRSGEVSGVGLNWVTPWYRYLKDRDGNGGFLYFNGLGGTIPITNNGTADYRSLITCTTNDQGDPVINYRSGARDTFAYPVTNGATRYFLTQHQDASGNITTFSYTNDNGVACVTEVIDLDRATNRLTYTTIPEGGFRCVSQVTDRYNRTATLQYDQTVSPPQLTNITDMIGLHSAITYSDSGTAPATLTTPYGTTTFEFPTGGAPALHVNDLGQRHHLFLYLESDTYDQITNSYAEWCPTTTNSGVYEFANTFDHEESDRRNSFYWGPRQYDLLPADFLSALTNLDGGWIALESLYSTNFIQARQRHWLLETNPTQLGLTLSFERNPSPDGTTPGQITWYDYDDKPADNPAVQGTLSRPRFVASKLPNGQSRFTLSWRNSQGNPTNLIDTWTDSAGNLKVRTNVYTYAANGIDLLTVTNALGTLVSSNRYNAFHQVCTNWNALGEMTIYTYDASNRLTNVRTPAELTTTNVYSTAGFLIQTIDLEINRTNSFTWTNGLILTHTDERGLSRTNTWDALNRLIAVQYPNGMITNIYNTNLDLIATIDRMGYSNRYEYNEFRQLLHHIDPLNRTNTFQYCTCGTPESAQDALGNPTTFQYDYAGRLVATVYADSFWVSNRFDLAGRLTNVLDSAGTSTTNWYNNQGLLVASSNAFGRVSAQAFDILDRATNSVDVNGVAVAMTYDDLDRVRTRTYPDNGAEGFIYSARGLVAYTNQLGFTNSYAYDVAGRKTSETNANGEITQFKYDFSGSLTNLIDGKNQNTFWKYDLYGRVTNKIDHLGTNLLLYGYDANDRLTSRTTPAKGATGYGYDAVGNLTNIDYAVSPDVSLQYDGNNRLTNLVTAGLFTNRFTYTTANLLASEDGPWDSDIVSYGYQHRLRTSLGLSQVNASDWTATYGFDLAKRLTNVTSAAGSFGYLYTNANTVPSPGTLVRRLTLPSGAYITNAFDSVGRELFTKLYTSTNTLLNSHQYLYNLAGQRTQQVFTASEFVNYTYDNSGQLKSAFGKEPGGTTNRLNERFGYLYDAAGNLNYRTNNALVQTFNVNSLNELVTVTRDGTLTVAGSTTGPATNVTVNTSNAVLYLDATFASTNHTLTDGTNTFTAIAKDTYGRVDTNVASVYLPASSSFTYDLNGNLLSDGRRGFDYDDENQLVRITVTNWWKSEFQYDGKMRRRVRIEASWVSGAWVTNTIVRYVYDGNLVLQEGWFNPQVSLSIPVDTVSYTRGTDLSGSFEGAGGIGGLLARSQPSTISSQPSTAFYHSDGNGNITALINANQVLVAQYRYDPYGSILSQSGPLAEANLYRFSSKELHANSGLVYYLYRFYDPNLQRWPNRDPIRERGGRNLYRFVRNNPFYYVDPQGLTIRFDAAFPDIPYWRDCICKLMSSPAGRELLRQAAQPDIDVQIKAGDQAETAGSKQAPIIFVNPNDVLGCGAGQRKTRAEQGELPPDTLAGCAVVLAHEFGHALHPGEDLGEDEPPEGRNIQEHENPVRRDFHIPERTSYDGQWICP
jgi:RHS repeat-associated protein